MASNAELVHDLMTNLGLSHTEILDLQKSAIRETKLLVVEGTHERDFFSTWLGVLHRDDIQVMPIGGKTLWREFAPVLVRQSKFADVESLVVVRDADEDASAAFAAACQVFTDNGLPAPAAPWQWQQGPHPKDTTRDVRTSVLILPSTDGTGALEELLLESAKTDPMFADAVGLVEKAVAILPAPPAARAHPPLHRRGKAKIHALLSTFERPDLDQGKAAARGVWDFNHAVFSPLKSILQNM